MATVVMVLAGLLGLCTCALKARDAIRHPERPALRALCIMLGVFGLAFIVTAPPITPWLSGVIGIPNSGRLVGNTLTLISAAALQAMMLYLAERPEDARPRVRVRLIALALAVTGMAVTLLGSDTVERNDFLTAYADYPPIIGYQFCYLAFLSLAITDLLTLSIRYSRYAQGALRYGLRLVAAGAVASVAYFAYKLALLIGGWTGHRPGGDESMISAALAGTAGILVAVGATMPLWGRHAAVPWIRLRQYVSYRRLTPLWSVLNAAVPEVSLVSGQAMAGRYGRGEIGIRLYRRVIEIRDAQLILRAHSDPAEVQRVEAEAAGRGLAGDRLRAEVDAVELITALRVAGESADRRGATAVPEREETDPADGDASLSSESRYLEKVAVAFRRQQAERPSAPEPSLS
ncbi:MAB_1171c family putative transporter [Actinoplanes sp. NPDC049118]|uniref:MAB_1171c family putative transporter n=1 Tax=Actinoplanes sp. NPDC049118 TaxID=3155769 RepID=UPI0033D2DF82